jgi:AraC-like DNA-binding protein
VEDGEFVRWEHSLLAGIESTAAANEYVVASFFAGALQMLGLDGYPIEVRLMHSRPPHHARYEEVFGPSVRFDAERNTIVMSRASLDAPLVTADPVMHVVLGQYVDELMKRLPGVHPFVERCREWVKKELPRGAALENMARAFHMSQSGVQRRLATVGTSHTEIVDEVRRGLATTLLGETELNISEIAFRLGFAHRPAFHRAFARWFGCSPTEHREQHASSQFYRFFRRGSGSLQD